MPSNWAMIDNSFPAFVGTESPRAMVAELQNYLMILVEQLKYQLNNLDNTNWNDTALKDLQRAATVDLENEVTYLLRELDDGIETLNALADRMQDAESAIAYLEEDAGMQKSIVAGLQNKMNGVKGDLDTLFSIISPDGSGGAQIGNAGKEIRLVGKVYVNGVLLNGGST